MANRYDDNFNENEYYEEGAGMKESTKKRLIIIAIIVGILALCALSFFFGYKIFNDAEDYNANGQDVKITITEDMSNADVASLLKENELIDSPFIFRIQIKMFTSDNYGIIPGEYTLNTSMSHKQMIDAMSGTINVETTEAEHLGVKD